VKGKRKEEEVKPQEEVPQASTLAADIVQQMTKILSQAGIQLPPSELPQFASKTGGAFPTKILRYLPSGFDQQHFEATTKEVFGDTLPPPLRIPQVSSRVEELLDDEEDVPPSEEDEEDEEDEELDTSWIEMDIPQEDFFGVKQRGGRNKQQQRGKQRIRDFRHWVNVRFQVFGTL